MMVQMWPVLVFNFIYIYTFPSCSSAVHDGKESDSFMGGEHVIDSDKRTRRIVLNSDEDIIGEINQLKATVQNLEQNLQKEQESVQALQANLQSAEEKLKAVESKQGQGSVYVRWGRNVCSDNADLLYKGFTAGKKWNDLGGGTDNLCLPEDPAWGKYHDGDESSSLWRSFIYGTEVDHEDQSHMFPYPVFNQDLPCAVCKSSNSVNVMIPARNICYPGWTIEYTGYLFAQSESGGHYAFNHLCLDDQPEFLNHGATDDNDHVLYMVEGRCGSLPCPPYVNGRELTCVVCST